MALGDWMTPDEKVKERQKAYSKFINVAQPLQQKQDIAESTKTANQGMRNVLSGIKEGGYSGRQSASTAMDQTQLELAKKRGEMAQEQDALNLQGAKMKEDIVGSRQEAALSAFNRETEEMDYQMNKAIAERAFDMGMTSKEMAFHANSQVADLGMEIMKEDYEKGLIDKRELETVKANLLRAAERAKDEAEAALNELKRSGQMKAKAYSREQDLALRKKYIEKSKEAMKQANRASNIAAIVSGVFSIGGAVVGGIMGGPAGAVVGMQGGKMLGAGANAAFSENY